MKILFGFLALVACWMIGYLVGSFIFVGFNPTEWDVVGRVFLALFSTMAGLFAFFAAVTL